MRSTCFDSQLIAGDGAGLSSSALDAIALADQSAFTFTKVASDFCSLGSDGKPTGAGSAASSAEKEVQILV